MLSAILIKFGPSICSSCFGLYHVYMLRKHIASTLTITESETHSMLPTSTSAIVLPAVTKPSLLSRIEAKVKLWGHEFVKDEPAIEKTTVAAIEFLAPTVYGVLAESDPSLLPIVKPIVDKVVACLAALSDTVEQSGPAPTVASIIGSISANLTELESALGVKSPKALAIVSTVQAGVSSVAASYAASAQTA